MSLASKLSHEFAARIQYRGARYFRERAVEVRFQSPARLGAVVRGRLDYQVSLAISDGRLNVACTCPYFDQGEECKHIWATILEADRLNSLSVAKSYQRLALTFDFKTQAELLESGVTQSGLRAAETSRNQTSARQERENKPVWQQQLNNLAASVESGFRVEPDSWPAGREIIYLIDVPSTRSSGKLTVDIGYRERNRKGEWGKFKPKRIPLRSISTIKDDADREILTILAGAKESYFYALSYDSLPNQCVLLAEMQQLLLPRMCAAGHCYLRVSRDAEPLPVEWNESGTWKLWLKFQCDESRDEYSLHAVLRKGSEELDVASALVTVDGLVIGPDLRAARLASRGVRPWSLAVNQNGGIRLPAKDMDDLLESLFSLPAVPDLDLPTSRQYEQVQVTPVPHLLVRSPKKDAYYPRHTRLEADLFFNYGDVTVSLLDPRDAVYQRATRRLILRDRDAEQSALELLKPIGFKTISSYLGDHQCFELAPKNLPRAVKAVLERGWKIEAEGKLYRQPGAMNMSVSSGIDWFELHGAVEFGEGLVAKLPDLLRALKRGESMVQLGDGSFGLLPDDWLKKYGLLTSLGETAEDHLRFKRTQTGVLDALLATQPEITFDETFGVVLNEWRNFKGIEPLSAPPGFVGALRDYQREGLGWFAFLERFGFGGCLADDMGLGKTVQVLALLEARRAARLLKSKSRQGPRRSSKSLVTPDGLNAQVRPSLVVVPRSLIFNWQQEAMKFTPKLRLLTHTGGERTKGSEHFDDYDLILTTYGILRRDALDFKDAQFDFVILDESQAIKNANTGSSKAVRLLQAKNRLALSGTPIENHLGELWSLFEFLNPGMFGAASVFQLATNGTRAPDEETRTLLARALRPFILRRTKEQVARELPAKLEQTIYCDMESLQRKQYDELREYYRTSLLDRVARLGVKRAKIQILEALLRLRQVACHPALVSGEEDEAPSAKLDVLMPRLSEVVAEGHKALVFSQFTSFLSIVRRRLESEGTVYEYLDGKTRDRGARVARFQDDPECKLFLISLKAGGLGLNLTAADYVFLLDPWWNPAVEAQAIDRAHRIGQSKRVFAYRLITRETVEEKVLALQATKRELADAIIGEDNSLIKNITGEELLLLLS
jgi:superfamily II DNA or RNA helicase